MQTVVAVSSIYGVAFNGRDMTPRENRDTALALKRAFDCIPTPAWLWRGLTLCSACSRDERTMGPRGPDVFNREQEHETGGGTAEREHAAAEQREIGVPLRAHDGGTAPLTV
ncbi:hypothetical protein LDHU3_27.2590:CDS1 [Leishmania donovani]|uniref:Hypothetical_protein n=1 Tax=Leishmania donovani TaxID=5661 RepID=A0A504XC07_LEIDO|nr:hypothetical protein CGC20_32485 [Leishmania donovani]CAJ1990053.1 hypothetical protein LDHU3_27.2590:CDS1 [Leishmania donovani]VDZ45910.1 hypothetical_protein [Leishmania donovani]